MTLIQKNNTPKIRKISHPLKVHGETRYDFYYWLRDDKREKLSILSYLKEENKYAKSIMFKQQTLNKKIFKEITNRIPKKDSSIPYIKNNYLYQMRYESRNEYPIYFRKLINTNKKELWEVLLDPNQFVLKNQFYSVGNLNISLDNHVMALSEDVSSRTIYRIRLRNLKENYWYSEVLKNVSKDFAWFNDSKNFLYIIKNPTNLLPFQIWKHTLGSSQQDDTLIYEEKDNTFYVNLYKTTSEKYIVIAISKTNTNETLLINADDSNAKPVIFFSRKKNHEYFLDHYEKYFYFRSNYKGKNFGIYRLLQKDKKWETIFHPQKKTFIQDYQLFHDWLVIKEQKNGMSYIRYICLATKKIFNINFYDPNYVIWLVYSTNPKANKLRYGYSSMITPDTIFELDLHSRKTKILKKFKIKSFNSSQYKNEYIWIKARDGIKIPVSLVYQRKDFQLKKNPLIVYAYGAYGISVEPYFSYTRLSLLNRGFVYAIAHVRGGGELGQEWYENGRLLKKMNTFNDFIDVTESLLKKGYGDPKRTYAVGGSAGGLLVSVVINHKPTLFHGAIAHVPFVDVLTTMLDPTIPLTTSEYEEWGHPKEKKCYEYIKKYSPYDNILRQKYPHLLVTSGLYDSQVQYWEPAKWVAKLREMKTDNNLIIFITDMKTGHNGQSGRFTHNKLISLEYTFLIGLANKSLK